MKQKLDLFLRKFSEAWTACAICMVQGNLAVFTVNHALTAAKTGLIAGLLVVFTSYFQKLDNKWLLAWMTGLMTTIADFVIHPTHFGEHYTEAVVTGIGAGILSIIMSGVLRDGKTN